MQAMPMWRRTSDQRGAAMVEMVVVLPILLFVLFAICELSRAWLTLQLTTTAVREGARAAAVATAANVSSEGVARLNAVLASAGITGQDPTVDLVALTCGTPPCDNEVVAQVDVVFTTLFPVLIPQLQTITMRQTARMRHEGT
jgi:Flp pilus assembly protein TadG